MKSIAIFLLVGLSLFYNGNCNAEEWKEGSGTDPVDARCLVKCAKETPALLKKLNELICWFTEGKSSGDKKALDELVSQIKDILKNCCTSDEIDALGLFGDAVGDIVEIAKTLVNNLENALTGAGLLKPVSSAACKPLKDIPNIECLKIELKKIAEFLKTLKAMQCGKCTPKLLNNLGNIFCSKPKDMEDTEEGDKQMPKVDEKACKNLLNILLRSAEKSGLGTVLKSLACAGDNLLSNVVGLA